MDSSTLPISVTSIDDDGSLSEATAFAKEASLFFHSGNFSECLRILNHLSELKPNDPKVCHNMVIAEQFRDGYKDPKGLIEALENIKKQSEKFAQKSGDHLDVSCNNGSNLTVGVMDSNNMTHQNTSSSPVYADAFDSSAAMFNIAVVWFHLHGYEKSFSYLDTLYQNIRSVDQGTALRICLLFLDVALHSHHASRSSDVISYMEKEFCGNTLTNQVENGTSTQQQSLLVSKSTSLLGNSTIPDTSNSDSTTLENSLTRTLSEEEVLEDEPLQLLSLDVKRQRPSGIAYCNDLQKNQTEESLSATDLRLNLHLFKVRLMILTRNLKAAKREVKLAMNVARGKDYPTALYLKSQLEYARGNHFKAIKLLMASGNHTEIGFSILYYNNLGCIYHRLGKYHVSRNFFSKALSSSTLLQKEKPKNLQTLSQNKSLMITYNCGVHSLTCKRPFQAARCFLTASQIFYKKPLLWIRIAECCLMALEKGLIKTIGSECYKSDIRVDVIGEGKWRKLAIDTGTRNLQNSQMEYERDSKQPNLSMSCGHQCLVKALRLLDSSDGKGPKSVLPPNFEESESNQFNSNGEVKDQKGVNSQNTNSFLDYEYIRVKEESMMKQAALANLAYVELALGKPWKALPTARSLLNLPDCSKMYIFLGTMYAAEALCLLNRPEEAAEQLKMYVSEPLPYNQEDCKKWTPVKVVEHEEQNVKSPGDESQSSVFASPEEAYGFFCANMAANFAMLGNIEKAQQYVGKALSAIPNNPQAILTAIYMDLKCGKTQEALAKLKKHSSVRFLPAGFTLKSSP